MTTLNATDVADVPTTAGARERAGRPDTETIRFGEPGRPVRAALVGDESLVVACAEIAADAGVEVVLVASHNPLVLDAVDRFGALTVDLRTEVDLPAAMRRREFDVLVSAAYRHIIPTEVLDQSALALNFHDGPLPGYAGLNVTTWAIHNGEREHGVTWHVMTDDVDAGAVIAADRFPLRDDETAFSLNARCYEAATATFTEMAPSLAQGSVTVSPQAEGDTVMYRRRDRPLVMLDPRQPAAPQARRARSLDLGNRVANEVGLPYLVVGDETFLAHGVSTLDGTGGAEPGAASVDESGALRITCADGRLVVDEVTRADGTPVPAGDVAARIAATGGGLSTPPPDLVDQVGSRLDRLAARETAWRSALGGPEIAPPVLLTESDASTSEPIAIEVSGDPTATQVATAVLVWLEAISEGRSIAFAVTDADTRDDLDALAPLLHPPVVRTTIEADDDVPTLTERTAAALERALERGAFLADLIGRDPALREAPPLAVVRLDLGLDDPHASVPTGAVSVAVSTDRRVTVRHRLDEATGRRVVEQLRTVLDSILTGAEQLTDVSLVGPDEQRLLDALNDTSMPYDRTATIDRAFAEAARTRPDDPAVSAGGRTLGYAELANAVAHMGADLDAAGVTASDVVAVALDRGLEMITSVLAILSRGATYLPLDPDYPVERLRFMVDDAHVRFAVATDSTAGWLAEREVTVIAPAVRTTDGAAAVDDASHSADDLAYLIYTSGSTGRPKGVELRHRNVVNFFAAMDEVVDHDPPGVWLAVTSLSFDISVLELLWTLTRGFHVVVKAESGFGSAPAVRPERLRRPVSMSMFYFAADPSQATDGYRMLLETATWADRQGFESVWIPERHFHDFGAPYANPSVAAAAIAVATDQIKIRAGSVVAPLHSPIRIAEEWAMVDNLSGGRVGISFAAGWQPNDFVLNPEAYATSKQSLPSLVSAVTSLWRGETIDFPGHDGAPVPVTTLPRPIQPELPVWLTSAGSSSTFERAGRMGVNVLTHLLGQSVEQLEANIALYRSAWAEAGHEGEGHITLMLHTFLDTDSAAARESAREPLKGYLTTAVGLLKDMASAFPTFANSSGDADEAFRSLSDDEMSQLLDMAADRYLSTSGLFGDVDDAVEMIRRVSAAGADEVACLVDFGVPTDDVLGSLDLLGEVHDRVVREAGDEPAERVPETVAELISAYGVTHLQCTPSLAAMLAANPTDRVALGSLDHMMVGGEALPVALAADLRSQLGDGRLTNMYGPTETTIWSLVHEVDRVPEGAVPIGRAIGNNTIAVLDERGRRLPIGVFGELHIGGDGVARGYHDRPELTAERFVDRPGLGRAYATGDVVRIHPDGHVEFGGRTDHQVKILGHRIELGEIETVLDRDPDVSQSVVVARGDDDPKLIAFVTLNADATGDGDAIRHRVATALPAAMTPSSVVVLDAMPLTPNGKIDRKQLPEASAPAPSAAVGESVTEGGHEHMVATVWSAELGRTVGLDDNFFDIGGHSLLAVKVFRKLADETDAPVALTDIFRYPTVRTFAEFLDGAAQQSAATPAQSAAAAGAERARRRRSKVR